MALRVSLRNVTCVGVSLCFERSDGSDGVAGGRVRSGAGVTNGRGVGWTTPGTHAVEDVADGREAAQDLPTNSKHSTPTPAKTIRRRASVAWRASCACCRAAASASCRAASACACRCARSTSSRSRSYSVAVSEPVPRQIGQTTIRVPSHPGQSQSPRPSQVRQGTRVFPLQNGHCTSVSDWRCRASCSRRSC